MSFKLTTTGGLQLARGSSIPIMQATVLGFLGKCPLYLRHMDYPEVVLQFDRDGTPKLTRHGTEIDLESDDPWIAGWIHQFTTAIAKIKEPT